MGSPKQKPGRSEQVVQTPHDFMRALCIQFNVEVWAMDLAANTANAVCPRYLGPGSSLGEDSLQAAWPNSGDLWLNPPFGSLDEWTRKCAARPPAADGRLFLLAPASVGAMWFANNVLGIAHVIALRPRLTFVGHKSPYPKDLVLAVYSRIRGGFSSWGWK